MQRRHLLHTALLLAGGWLPPTARGCEFNTITLRIIHPWSRATEPDATSAIVCMTFADVVADDRLLRAETPLAAAADVDIAIPAGVQTVLGETGQVLRLSGLTAPLEVAREYPLRLVFARGGSVNATLSIDYGRFR